ncbi:hypothetical protein EGH10_17490 [Brevibacillus laterosporus]|uniref:Uncharacterized protein n=1 Tax=Brevibacillus laterosporus LMG 15441 TaxID=1042163 RepID=A0A075R3Q3_BRELA|nr:hypothetical protein [Brevibacillus laterosporus]AIG26116.1 hypothetical protein BRLA_c017930 [Brevibacillus laterosporus LMG 15441]RJL06132.1 hypothetical protein DM460_22330 [Brevibacillus laterosporus]TPH07254.1 hypothetical protein EGH10_17490 [Brevibacillus laterosporus]
MLTIEEYIARRKREDHLNEFSIDDRAVNMKKCVDYIFEYFNQYLDITKISHQTVLNNERLGKYQKSLSQYEPEIQEWLIGIYDQYEKKLNRSIINILKKDELFYLYNSEIEFRSLSYQCYAQLIKKNPFLQEQIEQLFMFIKDHHQINSKLTNYISNIFISDEINEWIEKTWIKYGVNIMLFASNWVDRFFNNEDQWPAKHRIKSNNTWLRYDYDHKQKNNLFNINSLYNRISGKPFIKGKKQYLEVLMMYFWLHEIVGDEENYWQEYMDKCFNN